MSTEVMTAPVAEKKHRKHKDKSEKKASKKRRREGELAAEASQPAHASPTKKLRTLDASSSASVPAVRSVDKRNSAESPFFQQTTSFYLPLAPIGQNYPLHALCAEHFSPLLLTYYPPLKGVVLSYSNARLSEAPAGPSTAPVFARSVNEYAVSFVWATADFVVLRPQKGLWIEGFVNLQNESHLGLVCWNLFSASIDRKRLPEDWTWVEADADGDASSDAGEQTQNTSAGEGYYVDGEGNKIEGLIRFRIRDFETSPRTESDRGFISIEGSLLPDDEEKELDDQELQRWRNRRGGSQQPRQASGARR